jgi:hypothetical protein
MEPGTITHLGTVAAELERAHDLNWLQEGVAMENTKSQEEVEREVRSILSFHKGKNNPVSRWELVERVFGRQAAANRGNNNPFDRRIREVIAKYRDTDLIVSSSSVAGYWLAADMDDIELIAEEYVKRSREMEEKARNLRKRGKERFGPQMPLFKSN